jgi:hypothetical protein
MREFIHFPSLGPKEGRFDRAFARWCRHQGHLSIRTVELFWFLRRGHRPFRRTPGAALAREKWERQKWERRSLPAATKEGPWFVTRADPAHGIHSVILAGVHTQEQLAKYIAHSRGPGTWMQYYRASRTYFRRELARYQRTSQFWKACGSQMRSDFLRCMRYSNRIPEAHPDYFVRFRSKLRHAADHGFVEVKGPRESLRPSQKRFFPELVMKAGQRVWVARVESPRKVRLARFNAGGRLEPCALPR